ncbi:MAG: metallophosphoesterase [Nitrospira sp.]|nr:metallophosphoesterase [Nitrospira sp.]HNP28165.1 metallophosphoesterase [Nitrospirales bacterium]
MNSLQPGSFKFAHLSDPHLTSLQHISWTTLLNKRIMGYISWKTHRRAEHRREVLDLLVNSLLNQDLDHIVITGDLTHLGLPEEFAEARQWLDSLKNIAETTVIPGNHEAYVSTSYESTLKEWEPYFRSDNGTSMRDGSPAPLNFPSLRLRGPIAFIGLSTASPTLPFLATGTLDLEQLRQIETCLSLETLQPYFKVLLIHHPPLTHSVAWRKRLTNALQLEAVLNRHPVDLILHGHTHKSSLAYLNTPDRAIPVVGVPSASANGSRPGYESQYCLFSLNHTGKSFELSASLYSYFQGKEQFAFSRTLPLNR